MRRTNRGVCACVFLLAAALLGAGCSDDSSPVATGEEAAEYRALTSQENLIYNLVLSYDELNITEYSKLLLSTADGEYGQEYHWFNQKQDTIVLGEAYYARDEDISRTNNLFQAAKGTPTELDHPVIDKLGLEIFSGQWVPVDSLWGEPCDDCWETERDYYIRIKVGSDDIYGDDQVKFVVVPIMVGEVKEYRIAKALDILIQ